MKQTRYDMIRATNGKIFTATFRKRDGSIRTMNARTQVKKGVKGVGLKFDPKEKGLITVFDVHKNDFRMINLRKLLTFKCGSVEWSAK